MSDDYTRVAYQGARGAFSEDAVASYFDGHEVAMVPRKAFTDVRNAVLAGDAEYGVLPIENSIHGRVTASLGAYAMGGLAVVGEVTVPVHLCLLALHATQPEQLRRVLSHPVALNQCRTFLGGLPMLQPVAFYDTAGAAEEVAMRQDRTAAAVASVRAAARYDLAIIARNIEDRADNRTRFMVVKAATHAARQEGSCPERS